MTASHPSPTHPNKTSPRISVGLLTGGDDRPYALGIASALIAQNISVDFIGSDKLDAPELHQSPLLRFLNLRGDQNHQAPFHQKACRIFVYYLRLIKYAALAQPKVFHILWNNKYEFVDRVLLMLYYRALGKKVALTAHNVNAAKRDRRDSAFNRFTLGIQYKLCGQIFVHTTRMKLELETDFRVPADKISVIPFGINNTIPRTGITREETRARLGLTDSDKTLLFFGQIAPYKGLEYLLAAAKLLADRGELIHLIVAGKVKQGCEEYWTKIQGMLENEKIRPRVILHIRFIPDENVEPYFLAADAIAIPYVDIFQSGVPFLAFSFGLPVIATDVGSLREDIIPGETGFISPPCDPSAFANEISRYFSSPLYLNLSATKNTIQAHANDRYSWEKVGAITRSVYEKLGATEPADASSAGS